jgi:N-acetylglutamate synthase-like GNAT family acetyltransferase
MGLDWRQFIVGVDPSGNLVGCGQVKNHGDGSRELSSIAVIPSQRGKGIARAIIEHLLKIHPDPLYLTCRAPLRSFYEKFGFHVIPKEEMTPYFRRVYRIFRMLRSLRVVQEELLVMLRSDYAVQPLNGSGLHQVQ